MPPTKAWRFVFAIGAFLGLTIIAIRRCGATGQRAQPEMAVPR
jgi:hypothetical protein